jgi:hypothetical protein
MTRQEALHRVTHRANSALHWLVRVPTRVKLKVKDIEEAKELEKGEPILFILQQRQQDLVSFYSHYERLVEVLCDSAQYGPTVKLENAYQEERRWMQTHYFLIRPYVVAYLKLESEDAEQGILLQGFPGDGFQALFAAASLADLVKADDGNMISRIIRTREAVNLYSDHLKQLIGREKAC